MAFVTRSRQNRRLIGGVMIPTVLVQLGITAGESFVPLYALNLGASPAQAALFSAMLFIGQAGTDLPGGALILRLGERKVMLIGGGMMTAAMSLRITAGTPAPFIASILLSGTATSLIWLARMSWLKKEVRSDQRGYIMSFVGGSLRIALILGPLTGGFIIERFGYRALFIVQAVLQGSALAAVGAAMPKTRPSGEGYCPSVQIARAAWRKNRRSIFAAAIGIGGLSVLRSSRAVLFPLWGSEIGLGEGRIGIVMFAGAAVDAAFFWLSGVIMTHLGRKAAAVACTASLALAIGLLPAAGTFMMLILLSLLAGLGNAAGAGINLTVSNDLAPRNSPAVFLSFWRFAQGFAAFAGPALAAGIIQSAGSSAAPPVSSAAGFAGALIMALFMRETGKKRL